MSTTTITAPTTDVIVDITTGASIAPSTAGSSVSAATTTTPERAACEGLGVDMFFSDDFDDVAAAKLLCLQCPIRGRCLDEAVARGEQYGVWGGQLFDGGRIIMSKRRRGRPTKIARPGDALPEVALPESYHWLAVTA